MTLKPACQIGRVEGSGGGTGRQRQKQLPCPNEALPNSMLCAEHRVLAMLRLPDRSIGDRRGLRWGRNYA